MLKVGSEAPGFESVDQNERRVRLADYRGKWLVLYFYPKDETPGCIAESCEFRDQFAEFRDLDADVVGVSRDSPASHRAFAEHRRLPFTLLSDEGGAISKAYKTTMLFGLPGRVTYVIDPEGRIAHAHDSRLNPRSHVREALAHLKAARASRGA